MSDKHLKLFVMYNDRLITNATLWWLKNHPNKYNLFCAHKIDLNEECDSCREISK